MSILNEAERYMEVTVEPDKDNTNLVTWEDKVEPLIDELNAYSNPEHLGDLVYSERTISLFNKFLESFKEDHKKAMEYWDEGEVE